MNLFPYYVVTGCQTHSSQHTFTIVLYSTNGQREHSGDYSDKPCTYEQCIPLASLININLNQNFLKKIK